MDDLKSLIEDYLTNDKGPIEEFFKNANNYISYSRSSEELLNKVAFCVKNQIGYITTSEMDNLYKRMIRAKRLISRCDSFEEIFHCLYSCEKSELDPQVCYLASMYLGMNFYREKYYPNYLYLNDRNLDTAKAIIGNTNAIRYYNEDKKYPYVLIEDLPRELKALTPLDVELFLSLKGEKLNPSISLV